MKQPLAATRLAAAGQQQLWYSDAAIGVVYRRGTFTGTNQPPTAALTSPTVNANFADGAAISITANASDLDGTVASVEFYDGSNKLGEDTSAPYAFTWNDAPAGMHRLIARAKDNLGAVADSPAVAITVGTAQTTPSRLNAQILNGKVRLRLEAPAGNYAIEQSSDLRNWSERLPLTVGGTGSAITDDAIEPGKRFFRSRRK